MQYNQKKEKIMYCKSCGKEGHADAVACLGCGVPPLKGKSFCNSCGDPTGEGAVICIKCGCSLNASSSSSKNVDVNKIIGNVSFGASTGEPNPNPVESGTAILWFLLCYPIGYSQWGQSTKGWVCVLITFITGGFGGILVLADYIMCYNAQKTRKLGDWDFFPK